MADHHNDATVNDNSDRDAVDDSDGRISYPSNNDDDAISANSGSSQSGASPTKYYPVTKSVIPQLRSTAQKVSPSVKGLFSNKKRRKERRQSMLRGDSSQRADHLKILTLKRKIQSSIVRASMTQGISFSPTSAGYGDSSGHGTPSSSRPTTPTPPDGAAAGATKADSMDSTDALTVDGSTVSADSLLLELQKEVQAEMDQQKSSDRIKAMSAMMGEYSLLALGQQMLQFPLEVRLHGVSYRVPGEVDTTIRTVYNSSPAYKIYQAWKRWRSNDHKNREKFKYVLRDIDLVIKPGRMYLVLGPPGAGKTSLLKAISSHLNVSDKEVLIGKITYNGRTLQEENEHYIENAFAYIDQLDMHAPRLTVDETFEFAFQCKSGGTIVPEKEWLTSEELRQGVFKADKDRLRVNLILESLGLADVRDTFVGDTSVRGVSGGQRRRVTVGEMLMSRTPVLCGAEISTGLSAVDTYDMIQVLLHFGRHSRMSRIFSLLQPSPEVVSLFDEVILLGEGRILFAGRIDEVEDYFADLGYRTPEFMDVADFLQMVSTADGRDLYDPPPEIREKRPDPPTVEQLADIFAESPWKKSIEHDLEAPNDFLWTSKDGNSSKHGAVSNLADIRAVNQKYMNSFLRSTRLNIQRFLLIWLRDRRDIIASFVKNVLMGVSVGGVFRNVQDPVSILGAMFQCMLFIMLSAIQSASPLVSDRAIFRKHYRANFYSAWPFVYARTISGMPQTAMDVSVFGTILFFMVGLGDRQPANFFVFLSILFSFAVVMNQQLAVFATVTSASALQACSAVLLMFMVLFGGFIVAPEEIPAFFEWIYWWDPFAWAYRALVINEFRSDGWDDPDATLESLGFTTSDGEPFPQHWVALCFAYLCPYFLMCTVLAALGLTHAGEGAGRSDPPMGDVEQLSSRSEDIDEEETLSDFTQITLSFHDICYDVPASTKNQTLRLLRNVNGILRPGRMCSLMGTSGAGKTTLLDVLALRKRVGKVSGQVRLNGWPQDEISFRRCSGYVEQFDVQTPEMTVKETILFSARLRNMPERFQKPEDELKFVDDVMRDVEMRSLADVLVGSDDGEGLSFEQKKRLSIAVELAASPSLIFLDEPTSGLDARSAMLIVRTLRRIADSGRTICATIHQPSSAVFGMFDDLMLLKRGGEVVFHGDLGNANRDKLVEYFESKGAPQIALGDNPANWMLRAIASDDIGDPAEVYRNSDLFAQLKSELQDIVTQRPDESLKIQFDSQYAAPFWRRMSLVDRRLRLIYWRSPAYNLTRIMVSIALAVTLGSIFVQKRNQSWFTENEIQSRLSVIFLSFIIIGILAILSVLPVMGKIRDMFYRHKDSGMYSSLSLAWALGAAEKGFIVASSAIFCVVFLGVSGMNIKDDHLEEVKSLIAFWGFFTFNFAIYSYFGQCFVALVKGPATAVILSSVFIGLNNFFAGLIVRPQLMLGTFFAFPYYITPAHYVYEGLVVSLFAEDPRPVVAESNSAFFDYLVEDGTCTANQTDCEGSISQYMISFFGGNFVVEHVQRNAAILGFVLTLARVVTLIALRFMRFS